MCAILKWCKCFFSFAFYLMDFQWYTEIQRKSYDPIRSEKFTISKLRIFCLRCNQLRIYLRKKYIVNFLWANQRFRLPYGSVFVCRFFFVGVFVLFIKKKKIAHSNRWSTTIKINLEKKNQNFAS